MNSSGKMGRAKRKLVALNMITLSFLAFCILGLLIFALMFALRAGKKENTGDHPPIAEPNEDKLKP